MISGCPICTCSSPTRSSSSITSSTGCCSSPTRPPPTAATWTLPTMTPRPAGCPRSEAAHAAGLRRPRVGHRATRNPQRRCHRRSTKNAVRQAKEYIAAGDIFQVVLSQRLARPTDADPFSIYRALRRINPSPYMFFLDFGRAIRDHLHRSARRRRCWCGSRTAPPRCAPSRARDRAARRRPRTRRWRRNCSPTPKSAPST